jgi:hypothetical protein
MNDKFIKIRMVKGITFVFDEVYRIESQYEILDHVVFQDQELFACLD